MPRGGKEEEEEEEEGIINFYSSFPAFFLRCNSRLQNVLWCLGKRKAAICEAEKKKKKKKELCF